MLEVFIQEYGNVRVKDLHETGLAMGLVIHEMKLFYFYDLYLNCSMECLINHCFVGKKKKKNVKFWCLKMLVQCSMCF